MIARRATARERRNEVREHLARAAEADGRIRAPRLHSAPADREEYSAAVDRLARALAELGPVFAADGIYLASPGDLLRPSVRSCLAALDRGLQEAAEDFLGYFWHGVGRALLSRGGPE